jgi:hypothetical protein
MSLSALEKLRYYKNPELAEGILKTELAKRKLTVYGARATNVQLPNYLNKQTEDYDVLSKKPKKTALELLNRLNREYGGEYFRLEHAEHKGTFKIKSNVTNKTIADITQAKNFPKSKEHLGINYRELPSIKKTLKRVLSSGKAEFRKEKDLELLQRIELGENTSIL